MVNVEGMQVVMVHALGRCTRCTYGRKCNETLNAKYGATHTLTHNVAWDTRTYIRLRRHHCSLSQNWLPPFIASRIFFTGQPLFRSSCYMRTNTSFL